jgi:alcohol dehydrogenase class IV
MPGRRTPKKSRFSLDYSCFEVRGEPTVEQVAEGVSQARREKSNLVIGIGGGSVIDSAKAIAGPVTNPGSILDYLEVIGKGKQTLNPESALRRDSHYFRTGAEVTRNDRSRLL